MVERHRLLTYITDEHGHALDELNEDLLTELLIDFLVKERAPTLPAFVTPEDAARKLRAVFVGDPGFGQVVSEVWGHIQTVRTTN